MERGSFHRGLKQYQQAIDDYNQFLELDPNDAFANFQRGYTYLWLKNINLAKADFSRSLGRDSSFIRNSWLVIWAGMCQERPDSGMAERLDELAASDPEQYAAYVCLGVAMWLRRNFEEALQELKQAIQIAPEEWDAYFWMGMMWTSLGREKEAKGAIEKALEEGMPPVLLTPLKWFEQDRPDFYRKYVLPLMARHYLV